MTVKDNGLKYMVLETAQKLNYTALGFNVGELDEDDIPLAGCSADGTLILVAGTPALIDAIIYTPALSDPSYAASTAPNFPYMTHQEAEDFSGTIASPGISDGYSSL